MRKSTLPPIPNSLNFDSREMGSFDPFAFRDQLPGKPVKPTAYGEIAKYSMQAESLKQENELMRLELLQLVDQPTTNPYVRMKKSIVEFGARLNRREREVDDIKRHMSSSKNKNDPTFVEVDVHRDRQASFDLVATSLLVSNEQRTFFKAADLRRQNEELMALIDHQQEALKMVRARLQLYSQVQQSNSIRLRLESLRRGEKPAALAEAAPDQIKEQKMKIRMLSSELRNLVEQRKALSEARTCRREKTGKAVVKKEKQNAAILIQRIVRGFLVRLQMKKLQTNARKIQNAWRLFMHKKDAPQVHPSEPVKQEDPAPEPVPEVPHEEEEKKEEELSVATPEPKKVEDVQPTEEPPAKEAEHPPEAPPAEPEMEVEEDANEEDIPMMTLDRM